MVQLNFHGIYLIRKQWKKMLHDHICKVCGRPAPEGSEAYDFMLHKLEDYKRHAEAKN